MKLQEIQDTFPEVTVKDGDMGRYAEIRIMSNLYIHISIENEESWKPEFYRGQLFVSLLFGIKTIEDLKLFTQFILGNEYRNSTTATTRD